MAQAARQSRQSRSSAACDSCRSKKQKCGGEWPVCARCRESGNPCAWPQQLQRGPAKGYLEAIEARLDEVEDLLSQVLPLVPPAQLMDALAARGEWPATSAEGKSKRTTQEKKAAQDYWAAFPLNSPQAVLAWHQEHQRRTSALRPPSPRDVEGSKSLAQPAGPVPPVIFSDTPRPHPLEQQQDQCSKPATPNGSATQSTPNHSASRLELSPISHQVREETASNSQPGRLLSPRPEFYSSTPATPAQGNGIGLTAEFQAKFLW